MVLQIDVLCLLLVTTKGSNKEAATQTTGLRLSNLQIWKMQSLKTNRSETAFVEYNVISIIADFDFFDFCRMKSSIKHNLC